MAVNSLDSEFSLGIQSAKDTAATAYVTALCTVSGADVTFDERTPLLEHPGGAGSIPFNIKAAVERTGYLVPVNATYLLRPRFMGKVLRSFCNVGTTNNTTHYTHLFTPATNAQLVWLTALSKFVGATNLERKITNVRLTQVGIDAQTDQIQCQIQGTGLVEGTAAGTETKTAEIATEMSPYSGSITWSIAGTSITHSIRGYNVEFTQTLEDDDKVLFSNTRADLIRKSIGATGTVRGVDIDAGTYNTYLLIKRNSAVGTEPSLTAATGPLHVSFQSLSNITGAAVPFRLTVAFAKVQYEIATPNSQNDDIVRADISWRMIADDSPPFSITLVNDQSAI